MGGASFALMFSIRHPPSRNREPENHSDGDADNGADNAPNSLTPVLSVLALQRLQTFSLVDLLLQHVFHVQSQFFHGCTDSGNLLDGLLQRVQPVILADVFILQTLILSLHAITEQMYNEFLDGFDTPVNVHITVTKKDAITGNESLQFTNDIIEAVHSTANDPANGIVAHTYTMRVGDEIEVCVRKNSATFYDSIVGIFTHQGQIKDNPMIAIKGGMILNTQYLGA